MPSSRKSGDTPHEQSKPTAAGDPAGENPDATKGPLTDRQLDDVAGGLPAVQRKLS